MSEEQDCERVPGTPDSDGSVVQVLHQLLPSSLGQPMGDVYEFDDDGDVRQSSDQGEDEYYEDEDEYLEPEIMDDDEEDDGSGDGEQVDDADEGEEDEAGEDDEEVEADDVEEEEDVEEVEADDVEDDMGDGEDDDQLGCGHVKAAASLFKTLMITGDKRNRSRQCKGCKKVLKAPKPSELVAHSKRCRLSDTSLTRRFIAQYEVYRQRKAGKATTRRSLATTNDKHEIDLALTDYLAASMAALNTLESIFFKNLLSKLNPHYNIPTRQTMSDVILADRAVLMSERTREALAAAPDRTLTLEFDCWTSPNHLSLMAVTVTNKSGLSSLLDLVDVGASSHTAEYLLSTLMSTLKSSALTSRKVGSIISDDASNCKKARRLFVTRHERGVIEMRCLAHMFNLMTTSARKHSWIQPTISALTSVVNYICKNQRIVTFLKDSGALQIIHSVPTRWHTTSYCINSVLRVREYLEQVPKTAEYAWPRWGPLCTDRFWQSLESLRFYFDIISESVKIAERSGQRVSVVTRHALKIMKNLTVDNIEPDRYRDVFLEAIVTHLSRANLVLLFAAYYFDPNYRLQWLSTNGRLAVEDFVANLLKILGHLTISSPGMDAVVHEFKRYHDRLRSLTAGSVTDVYEWWRDSPLVNLRVVGMRFAALQSSSANTERFFSAMGRILGPDRNRMHSDTLKNLMTVRTAIMSQVAKKNRRAGADASPDEGLCAETAEFALNGEPLDPEDSIVVEGVGLRSRSAFIRVQGFIDWNYILTEVDPQPELVEGQPGQAASQADVSEAMRQARLRAINMDED